MLYSTLLLLSIAATVFGDDHDHDHDHSCYFWWPDFSSAPFTSYNVDAFGIPLLGNRCFDVDEDGDNQFQCYCSDTTNGAGTIYSYTDGSCKDAEAGTTTITNGLCYCGASNEEYEDCNDEGLGYLISNVTCMAEDGELKTEIDLWDAGVPSYGCYWNRANTVLIYYNDSTCVEGEHEDRRRLADDHDHGYEIGYTRYYSTDGDALETNCTYYMGMNDAMLTAMNITRTTQEVGGDSCSDHLGGSILEVTCKLSDSILFKPTFTVFIGLIILVASLF